MVSLITPQQPNNGRRCSTSCCCYSNCCSASRCRRTATHSQPHKHFSAIPLLSSCGWPFPAMAYMVHGLRDLPTATRGRARNTPEQPHEKLPAFWTFGNWGPQAVFWQPCDCVHQHGYLCRVFESGHRSFPEASQHWTCHLGPSTAEAGCYWIGHRVPSCTSWPDYWQCWSQPSLTGVCILWLTFQHDQWSTLLQWVAVPSGQRSE